MTNQRAQNRCESESYCYDVQLAQTQTQNTRSHPIVPHHVVHSVHHAAHVGVHLPVATAPVVCRWTHGLRTHALVAIAVPILGVVLGRPEQVVSIG